MARPLLCEGSNPYRRRPNMLKTDKLPRTIKIKTNIRGGGLSAFNHNRKAGLIKIKTNIRAAGLSAFNHNRNTLSA